MGTVVSTVDNGCRASFCVLEAMKVVALGVGVRNPVIIRRYDPLVAGEVTTLDISPLSGHLLH